MSQFMRVIGANARNPCIVVAWPRLGCKLIAQKLMWRLSHRKNFPEIKRLSKESRDFRWLTSYRTTRFCTRFPQWCKPRLWVDIIPENTH